MNTSKQINIIVLLLFISVIATGAYTLWDPDRASQAEDRQLELTMERAAYLFSANCRVCHGDSGEGGAESNRLREAPRLDRDDLQGIDPDTGEVNEQTKQQVFGVVFNTISCGRVGRAMPTWGQENGGTLNDEQIRQLTTLITEGTGWEMAKEFAIEGVPVAAVHGDSEVAFTLVEPIDEETTEVVLSDVSALAASERLQFDEELMVITAVHPPGLTVTRGEGGTQNSHERDAVVVLDGGGDVRLTRPMTEEATEVFVTTLEPFAEGDEIRIDEETMTVEVVNTRHFVEVERGFGTTRPEAHALDAELLKPPVPPDPPPVTQPACGQNAPSAETPVATETPSATLSIVSEGTVFNKVELRALPDVALTLTHDNRDSGVQHNWEVYEDDGFEELIAGTDPEAGPVTQTLNFGPMAAGEYFYQCVIHPGIMEGILVVGADVPAADGATPPADGAATGTPAAEATPAP